MESLTKWLQENTDDIVKVFNVVVALVAAIVIGIQLMKAILAARKNSYNEIGKIVGSIVIVVVVAGLGIAGAIALGNAIRPDDLNYTNSLK